MPGDASGVCRFVEGGEGVSIFGFADGAAVAEERGEAVGVGEETLSRYGLGEDAHF